MIEVVGLTKRHGAQVAISDVSFAVAPGRVTGFLGPNGAGKSSTLRILLGLDPVPRMPTASSESVPSTQRSVASMTSRSLRNSVRRPDRYVAGVLWIPRTYS